MLTLLTTLRSSVIRYSVMLIVGVGLGIALAKTYYTSKVNHLLKVNKLMQQQLTQLTATNNSCQLEYGKLQNQVAKMKLDYAKKIRYYLQKIKQYQKNPFANLQINSNAPECQQLKMMLEQWRKYELKNCTSKH